MVHMITVRYESEILGSDTFWRGPVTHIREIRNLPARRLAEMVAKDGVERRSGMWIVSRSNPS